MRLIAFHFTLMSFGKGMNPSILLQKHANRYKWLGKDESLLFFFWLLFS